MITTPTYATREDVKEALDYKETARANDRVDRLLLSSTALVDDLCHRTLPPWQGTRYFDWPNFQRAVAWRLWLDQNDLLSLDSLVSGGTEIPLEDVLLEPVNSGPPYSRIELNIGTNAAFDIDQTHQRSIAATGTWGFTDAEAPAGTATASATSSAATLLVSDSSAIGVGQLLRIGTERLVVGAKSMVSTGCSLQADMAANVGAQLLNVPAATGATFAAGETLLLDAERMRITDIAGDQLIVQRAWDGSVLAAHSGSVIYAPRQLTVTRAVLGTTAASVAQGAAIARWVVPGPVQQLAIAYTENGLLSETAGYARTVGTAGAGGAATRAASSVLANINALQQQVYSACGRKGRARAV